VASEDLKRIVATQVASGHAISEMAKHHGYTYNGMWKLVNRPDVQALADEHRRHLSEVYTRTWFRLAEHGEALTAGMLEDAFNPDCAKQFEARKYCLDQLAPAKNAVNHSGQIDVRVDVAAEILMGLKESIDKISEVRGPAQLSDTSGAMLSRLRDGRDMVPDAELVAEDGGPARRRTRHNGDLTHPATPPDLAGSEGAQKFNDQQRPVEEPKATRPGPPEPDEGDA
jgi:hypothetical protein